MEENLNIQELEVIFFHPDDTVSYLTPRNMGWVIRNAKYAEFIICSHLPSGKGMLQVQGTRDDTGFTSAFIFESYSVLKSWLKARRTLSKVETLWC